MKDITPIRKVNIAEEIYDQLREQLIAGRWAPGDRLPSENELAELFGVSRITVRQALQKLKALGLIETRLGAGSYVKEPDAADIFSELIPTIYLGNASHSQIIEFRRMIDSESVRLATPAAAETDFDRLDAAIRQMEKAAERDDIPSYAKSDLVFHMRIVKITKNPLFIKTYSILQEFLELSVDAATSRMKYSYGIDYHKKILTAMRARDAEEACRLMREHLDVVDSFFES